MDGSTRQMWVNSAEPYKTDQGLHCLPYLHLLDAFRGCMVSRWETNTIEPSREIMVLFVLNKLILKTRMHSRPVWLDVWFLVGPFFYFHTLCVRTAKALARLRGCTGLPEPSLVAYVITTIITWAGSLSNSTSCPRHQTGKEHKPQGHHQVYTNITQAENQKDS